MYTFTGRVRFSETDEDGRLSLVGIMNYLQDCTVFHSEDVGAGTEVLLARDRLWLLNSWQIVILERPKCCEYIETGTQPYRFKGTFGLRNFRIRKADGTDCVIANSTWFMVQPSVMKPVRVTPEETAPYTLAEPLDMEYAQRRIRVPEGGEEKQPILVQPEHIDRNHHVNNSQYVIMARRYLPEGFGFNQVRAEYRYQALVGDRIIPVVSIEGDEAVVQLKKDDRTTYAVVTFSQYQKHGGEAVSSSEQ